MTPNILVSKIFLGFIICLLSQAIHAEERSPKSVLLVDFFPSYESYPTDGVLIGQGWLRGVGRKVLSRCVTGESFPIEGGSAFANFKEIIDREDLATALRVSASGSYGSFSASASYSKETQVSKFNRNILATINVDKGGTQLAPAKSEPPSKDGAQHESRHVIEFTHEALAILQSEGPSKLKLRKFRSLCGDSFVASIRNGGQYVVTFKFAQTNDSLKESFKASASGSYGVGGGSASFQKELSRENSLKNASVDSYQLGGDLTIPQNADEALKKISSFPTFIKDQAAPYQIVLMPYQLVAGWPDDLNNEMISDWDLKNMVGHMWRLQELSNLYADAALNPINYYFPFQKPEAITAQLAEHSSVLRYAAYCIDGFVAACAYSGNCGSEDFSKHCPAKNSISDPERSAALALALPKETLETANHTDAVRISKLGFNYDLAYNPDTPDTPSKHESDVPFSAGPFALYYKYLASAPLNRAPGNISDEAQEVETYCRNSEWAFVSNCDVVKRADLYNPPKADNLLFARKVYARWAGAVRVGRVSAAFCRADQRHPMCRDISEIIAWGDSVTANFGNAHNYIKENEKPADIEPSKPKPMPRPKRECDITKCPERY